MLYREYYSKTVREFLALDVESILWDFSFGSEKTALDGQFFTMYKAMCIDYIFKKFELTYQRS